MDELKELRDEFSYSTILNEWVKKLNLNFKVEFLNSFINSQGSIYYQIKIVDPQTTISSELADIVILINVNEKKLSQDITNHEKNTMGLQEEMDDCTKGLLRTLFYLKAALVTVHNFMLEPKKEISS